MNLSQLLDQLPEQTDDGWYFELRKQKTPKGILQYVCAKTNLLTNKEEFNNVGSTAEEAVRKMLKRFSPKKDNWNLYSRKLNEIECRVSNHLTLNGVDENKQLISYSAYEEKDNLPQDNLDEIALQGKAIFCQDADVFYGGDQSSPFKSKVVENPTWLDVCLLANEMILTTNDRHHVFLEAIKKTRKTIDGIPVYKFSMGS